MKLLLGVLIELHTGKWIMIHAQHRRCFPYIYSLGRLSNLRLASSVLIFMDSRYLPDRGLGFGVLETVWAGVWQRSQPAT